MYPDRNETLSFDNKVAIVSQIGLDFRSVFSQNHNKKQKKSFCFFIKQTISLEFWKISNPISLTE